MCFSGAFSRAVHLSGDLEYFDTSARHTATLSRLTLDSSAKVRVGLDPKCRAVEACCCFYRGQRTQICHKSDSEMTG
jgi:hypothetical protein